MRSVPEVDRGGGAQPAEPQVRHVQRLDGPATAPARDQRVLAHRRAAVVAAAAAASAAPCRRRRRVLSTATGQLLPALAPAATAGREDVQADYLLRDPTGRGPYAHRLSAAAAAVAGELSVRPVRARPGPVLRRFPTVGPEQVNMSCSNGLG